LQMTTHHRSDFAESVAAALAVMRPNPKITASSLIVTPRGQPEHWMTRCGDLARKKTEQDD